MLAISVLLLTGVLSAPGETVLLNFSGPNCPHCRAMEPVVAKLEATGVPVSMINCEQHPEIAQRFNVQRMPTYVMLVDGKETGRVVGATSLENLSKLFPSGASEATAAPAKPSGNYIGERLGGLFGKSGGEARPSAPSADPFTARGVNEPPVVPSAPREPEIATVSATVPISPESAIERAMAAAVRLKVEDAQGHSIGSGTIIDSHEGEALVVTCGHIFRQSQGKGKVTVDLFHPQPRSVEGKVIGYDLKRDIAVIAIKVDGPVESAQVAMEDTTYETGEQVFSIGCDHGAAPTPWQTKVTGVDRYKGPPNIEAAKAPVDGRSGGGLFNGRGFLIGVCNAADPADNEGIYAAKGTIHWQLDQVGLSELYKNRPAPAVAVAPPAMRSVSVPNRELVTNVAPRSLRESPTTNAMSASDTEVICIVRSKSNPAARNQVFVLDSVTPDLLNKIAGASNSPTAAADIALTADRRNAIVPVNNGPVIRGQSQDR